MNKLAVLLGVVAIVVALVAAPVPLAVSVQNPTRVVVIYPNLLFAVPLVLLGGLLLAYGATVEGPEANQTKS